MKSHPPLHLILLVPPRLHLCTLTSMPTSTRYTSVPIIILWPPVTWQCSLSHFSVLNSLLSHYTSFPSLLHFCAPSPTHIHFCPTKTPWSPVTLLAMPLVVFQAHSLHFQAHSLHFHAPWYNSCALPTPISLVCHYYTPAHSSYTSSTPYPLLWLCALGTILVIPLSPIVLPAVQ